LSQYVGENYKLRAERETVESIDTLKKTDFVDPETEYRKTVEILRKQNPDNDYNMKRIPRPKYDEEMGGHDGSSSQN